jgi:hypothetical protein
MLYRPAVQISYSQQELDAVLERTPKRTGWNFSAMTAVRQPVPWEYGQVVARYLRSSDEVLDVGTGGGERFGELAGQFARGLGVDIDPEMVLLASRSCTAGNLRFAVDSARLEGVAATFDVIMNRHAEVDLHAVRNHLKPGGYFITQQVGERNMACVRAAAGQPAGPAPIRAADFAAHGLRLIAFAEYDVEYVVSDIESLVFWLSALDLLHADLDGVAAIASAAGLNKILAGRVDDRGFVTNEHRYLAIGQA